MDSYVDDAVGYMEKNEAEKLAVTRVVLGPRIGFGGTGQPSAKKIDQGHHISYVECFIANSAKTEVVEADE